MEHTQNSTPLLTGHDYEVIRRCPKCASVFISDEECESCGYRLNYNSLGEAFGDKSFYGLKENYWSNKSKIAQLFPQLESRSSEKALKYVRELEHRYDILIDYLLSESDEDRGFYWLELKDLCLELVNYSFSLNKLSSRLHDRNFHGYAPLIHDFLRELEAKLSLEETTLWNQSLNYRVGEVVTVRFLFLMLTSVVGVAMISLLTYQYLLLFS